MVNNIVNKKNEKGFLYSEISNDFINKIKEEKKNKKTIFLFGATFSLIHLFSKYDIKLTSKDIVLETGGLKNYKTQLTDQEVLFFLKNNSGTKNVYSEYGMTELLSQFYSDTNRCFYENSKLKVIIRNISDPFIYYKKTNIRGGINIIDLANQESCSFIQTDDLGIKYQKNSFKVLGRLDNTEIKGCSSGYVF